MENHPERRGFRHNRIKPIMKFRTPLTLLLLLIALSIPVILWLTGNRDEPGLAGSSSSGSGETVDGEAPESPWDRVGQLAAAAPPMVPVGANPDEVAEAAFRSGIVAADTPGHAVDIDIDIRGVRELLLIVDDADDGIAADWANWMEPRLIDERGDATPLTDLEWTRATTGWGQVRRNANTEGGPMRVDGEEVSFGIGVHSHSEIVYLLPEDHDFVRFVARAGIDHGGVSQNMGASVRFSVYADEVPRQRVRNSRDPGHAVEQLDVSAGLDVTLFASEPMITSPANIDIDHLGRIWLADVQNYRGQAGTRPEGDRILILEDTDGDGVADKVTTFYQGNDIDSLLGITVLGNKVIVACSPNVFIFHDDTGDGKADRKELLFTDTGQIQWDHSAHRFVFGPDGKVYWNFGDTGHHVHDADGNIIVDLAGNEVRDNGNPYRKGMAFRCNLDGSEFEVLGHNFRNPYELTVDSFGTVWQSDNDDDGNRACRINFLMEFGNYGYTDERTGAGWRAERVGMHPEVPLRHWYTNDPGVVPNVLDTGAGSPAGIIFYEGDLLGETFRNRMIHTEPGRNLVRAYPVVQDGAGYAGDMIPLLHGARDNWFRPVSLRTAPDGSVFVIDWYDPGVGGHAKGDESRGRVFRIAPPGNVYSVPEFDYTTAEGAVEALKNPNESVRYMAWTALNEMGEAALPALRDLYESDDPRFRARALWLLSKIEGSGEGFLETAVGDENEDIRITALRAARQIDVDILDYVRRVARDPSPRVRREALIALRHQEHPEAANLWAELAEQHTPGDRWYVEALGIAADRQWEPFFDAWLAGIGGEWDTPAGREIVWRSRFPAAVPLLAEIIADPATPRDALPRYFRALDFHNRDHRRDVLVAALGVDHEGADAIAELALGQLGPVNLDDEPGMMRAVERALEQTDTGGAVRLIEQFELRGESDRLLEALVGYPNQQTGVRAARLLLAWEQIGLVERAIDNEEDAGAILQTLGMSGEPSALPLLESVLRDAGRNQGQRAAAVRAMGMTRPGETRLLRLVEEDGLAEDLHFAAANVLYASNDHAIREAASERLTLPGTREAEPLPPVSELVGRTGNAARGSSVYRMSCIACHQVNGEGIDFGPDLSEIGDKLAREAMYTAILDPDSTISFNYRGVRITLDNGNVVSGFIASETDETIIVRQTGGISTTVLKADVVERAVLNNSLMPPNLQLQMTEQELVDLVEYLTTLRGD